MIPNPLTMSVPLTLNNDGAITVGDTRVTFDVLIARYHQGDTPEQIHAGFPTIPLNDIYVVIAYYLSNQGEMDNYLQRRDEEAQKRRQEIEADYTSEQKARHDRLRRLIKEKRRNSSL